MRTRGIVMATFTRWYIKLKGGRWNLLHGVTLSVGLLIA
uniref:Uncharacterized protein n=1 Tax=Anguilla anguilla TaxID=7936 RepID=A0A0E9PEZ8_ANGAN